MARRADSTGHDASRRKIAAKVRELRLERKLTQQELATRLHISQNRLSEVERGDGSFTAEQFLELLRLFNVSASDFAVGEQDPTSPLQDALVRFGATHLRERGSVTSKALGEVHDVVREALVEGSPRLVTALAPVLVHHAASLNLPKVYAELQALGLERRLAWVVENTIAALGTLASDDTTQSREWTKLRKRTEVPFGLFLGVIQSRTDGQGRENVPAPDVIDATIRSLRTVEEVRRSASPISQRWGIVTSLQPEDFVEALKASHASS